ncbi:hypothetical protein CXB51_016518 [Gossypium anomalum]|uniref:Aminotransferase-like plant mobile domain-containing protein n=1 Tax=Gossypium anomalum TaxID=47600 RepID=A0A8J6CV57_9ROSI|nr:hypothetical protein CXB51_016518 [Gossypium anomalum]
MGQFLQNASTSARCQGKKQENASSRKRFAYVDRKRFLEGALSVHRPETHTFHLPCGECTITLEDVHLQLGLPVDGDAVTGSVHSADWGAIIGGYLIPDLSRNLVHLRWLLKLVDFRATGEFSWGSVVLATLYQEMCGAKRSNKAKIRALLQSRARFRFPFLRPRVDHPYTFPLIMRWNHSASYARLPTCLEDIRLLLEQRSEAQFQWKPYEDPAIRAVILDEYLQNLNAWHVKVLDDHHKINLRQLHTDWPRFWSHYIQMWEDRYDYIPTREPIIVPELACVPEYMPWFRIHGKPYLLSEEERQWQLRVQRERRGPLNPRRRDDDAGPSTVPTQSPGPATGPTQSAGPTVQPSTPTAQPLQMMPGWNAWLGSSPFPITPSGPLIYRQPSHKGSQEGPSESSSFYQSPSSYGFQTPPPLMMQTPPQSLFYQGGSSSQHPQPES